LFDSFFSRRLFLKASMAGAFLLAGGKPAFPKVSTDVRTPEGKLNLYNNHSKERFTVNFRDSEGNYDLNALNSLNWILRCHSGETTDMDVRVIEYLNLVDKELGGGNEIHIISGYRSPTYNSELRREGHGVARHSFHMKGKAIDIAVPGVGLDKLRRVALNLRYGGVGYYPGPGFVHIDSGNFRTW
jgi:uncharacterized protein YcbK (DUF882 family)